MRTTKFGGSRSLFSGQFGQKHSIEPIWIRLNAERIDRMRIDVDRAFVDNGYEESKTVIPKGFAGRVIRPHESGRFDER